MSKDEKGSFFRSGMALGFFIASVIWFGILVSFFTPRIMSQHEAVKHNAAHWATRQDGSCEFKWNDEAGTEVAK